MPAVDDAFLRRGDGQELIACLRGLAVAAARLTGTQEPPVDTMMLVLFFHTMTGTRLCQQTERPACCCSLLLRRCLSARTQKKKDGWRYACVTRDLPRCYVVCGVGVSECEVVGDSWVVRIQRCEKSPPFERCSSLIPALGSVLLLLLLLLPPSHAF